MTSAEMPGLSRIENSLSILMNNRATPAQLAEVAGLPIQSAKTLIEALSEVGWLRTVKSNAHGDESPPSYEFDPMVGSIFGVDVGGTKVHAALADASGTLLAETVVPTAINGGIELIDQIVELRQRLLPTKGKKRSHLEVASIGLPGAIHPRTGEITMLPNIAGMDSLDFKNELEDRLGFQVLLENDVNLAAYGEYRLGHGREVDSFVFVAHGTGIGMGIINEGRLVRGAKGAAGEIANLPIGGDPFDSRSFFSGALEAAISSEAIRQRYYSLGGISGSSVRRIFEHAREGRESAVIDEVARVVAVAISAVSAVLDPEIVVFGGSIGCQPDLVCKIESYLGRCCSAPPRCVVSSVRGGAGVKGAIEKGKDYILESIIADLRLVLEQKAGMYNVD